MTEVTEVNRLGQCPYCGDNLRLSLNDIDGWIACVACDGCDMRGPMSEWKYADQEEARDDGLARWQSGWCRHRRESVAEVERERDALREALGVIRDGEEPRPIGKHWRADCKPTKYDKCVHDKWLYDTCGECVAEVARAALSKAEG